MRGGPSGAVRRGRDPSPGPAPGGGGGGGRDDGLAVPDPPGRSQERRGAGGVRGPPVGGALAGRGAGLSLRAAGRLASDALPGAVLDPGPDRAGGPGGASGPASGLRGHGAPTGPAPVDRLSLPAGRERVQRRARTVPLLALRPGGGRVHGLRPAPAGGTPGPGADGVPGGVHGGLRDLASDQYAGPVPAVLRPDPSGPPEPADRDRSRRPVPAPAPVPGLPDRTGGAASSLDRPAMGGARRMPDPVLPPDPGRPGPVAEQGDRMDGDRPDHGPADHLRPARPGETDRPEPAPHGLLSGPLRGHDRGDGPLLSLDRAPAHGPDPRRLRGPHPDRGGPGRAGRRGAGGADPDRPGLRRPRPDGAPVEPDPAPFRLQHADLRLLPL